MKPLLIAALLCCACAPAPGLPSSGTWTGSTYTTAGTTEFGGACTVHASTSGIDLAGLCAAGDGSAHLMLNGACSGEIYCADVCGQRSYGTCTATTIGGLLLIKVDGASECGPFESVFVGSLSDAGPD